MSNESKLTEKENKDAPANEKTSNSSSDPKEQGGRKGLEPTRYGDWEKAGRCIDF